VHNQTVSVGAQEISYLESEGTGRPVVFVHGNSSSARTWQPLLEAEFGSRFRCLALDLPGHGHSAPARDRANYSIPGYAEVLTGFTRNVSASDAVVVGWSLGGHITLEAAPHMLDVAGRVIFGTPPVSDAGQLGVAFLPNPVMNVGFMADVSRKDAEAFAASFTAPGSTLALDDFVADILATDGAARASMLASISEGRFADELALVGELAQPLAILHGAGEQLVSFDYLEQITVPTLWRGEIMVIDGAGHAPHQEMPHRFASLLEQFIADLDG